MNFSKKMKTLVATTILAIGIPAAGIAYASPGQLMNMIPGATQQMNQNAGTTADTAQQLNMTPGVNSPMTPNDTFTPADNSTAPATMPMASISPGTVQNQAQMPQMNTNQMPMNTNQMNTNQMPLNTNQMNANHQAMATAHQASGITTGTVHHSSGGMGMGR